MNVSLKYFSFSVALFQPVFSGTREFDDVVNILQSAYLDCNSKDNFTYKKASLIHGELLEKEVRNCDSFELKQSKVCI